MIRVLHIISSLKSGGIQSLLMNIYRTIDRSCIQFDFLVFSKDDAGYQDEIATLGGKVFYIKARGKGINQNKKDLIKFFSNHSEYKIVHQHVSTLSYVTPLKIATKFKVPVTILHAHSIKPRNSALSKLLHYVNKIFITKYSTDYLACSNQAAEWLFPRQLINKCQVINNGIEAVRFSYDQEIRKRIREKLELSDHFIIGHIGRFSYPKNHEFIIDIFRNISTMYKDSRLLLVGDGNLRKSIEKKIKDYNLEERVILTGARHDTNDLLQAMDVFIFPSHYEGFGIALLEAQTSGLKCFASSKVVPEDVNITGLVNFIGLDKNASFWANEIIKNKNYVRESKAKSIVTAGYDVTLISNSLQNWYEEKLRNY